MKRYDKYKPSGIDWIGEVPSHWKPMKLKFVSNFYNGYAFKSDTYVDDGKYNIVTIANVQSEGFIITDCKKIQSLPSDIKTYQILHKGDLLMSLTGNTGRVCFVDEDDCLLNQRVAKIVFLDNIHKQFAYYILSDCSFVKYLTINSDGSAQLNAKKEDVCNYCFFLPTLAEQEAIAAYLDSRCGDIDKVVATQEKRIALLNEMKQSIITQAVTRGLNPDAKMKDSGVEWIGMVPEHWEVKKLKFVSSSISKGAGITKEQVVEDGDTQCVRYGEIYTKYNHSFDSCVSATNKDLHPVLQYFGYGDILFTCTGELVEEIGKSVVYLGHERCLAGGDILVVSHNQDPSFLNYALNSYAQIQKSEGRAKLKVVHISTYDISNLLLALPPIEEQKQIADEIDHRCSSIDKQIGAVTRQIELLREYKQSLITDVVTGKRKVC